jgi:thioredoxin 1
VYDPDVEKKFVEKNWSDRIMAAEYIADEAAFDTLIKEDSVVVVDCTASWCGPCKLVAPLMDQLAEEYDGKATVSKLDLDSNKAVANRFGIKSIPAVMFFKNGELVDTLVGVKPYSTFSETVTSYL